MPGLEQLSLNLIDEITDYMTEIDIISLLGTNKHFAQL